MKQALIEQGVAPDGEHEDKNAHHKHMDAETYKAQQDCKAAATLREHPSITRENYRNIDTLIQNETANLQKATETLQQESLRLKDISDMVTAMERVMGGTYVQHLVGEERKRREAAYLPNGLRK